MKIYANRLLDSLKQSLKPIYLVTGDEPLLVDESCELITRRAAKDQIEHKQRYQADRSFSWQIIADEINSFSLFDENSIIEINLLSYKIPDDAKEIIINACENPSESKIIILKCAKLDASTLKSTWCSAIETVGDIVQCWPITIEQLPRWIRERLEQQGLTATPDAVNFIAEHVEGNLLAAKQEIEKLSLLYDKKNLQIQDVMDAMHDNARYDIFNLTDTILSGNLKRTQRILTALKQAEEEPTLMLWSLTKEIRTLLALKHAITHQENIEKVCYSYGVWEKRKPLIKAALKRLKVADLDNLLRLAATADQQIKGVASGNPWLTLNDIALQLAGASL